MRSSLLLVTASAAAVVAHHFKVLSTRFWISFFLSLDIVNQMWSVRLSNEQCTAFPFLLIYILHADEEFMEKSLLPFVFHLRKLTNFNKIQWKWIATFRYVLSVVAVVSNGFFFVFCNWSLLYKRPFFLVLLLSKFNEKPWKCAVDATSDFTRSQNEQTEKCDFKPI